MVEGGRGKTEEEKVGKSPTLYSSYNSIPPRPAFFLNGVSGKECNRTKTNRNVYGIGAISPVHMLIVICLTYCNLFPSGPFDTNFIYFKGVFGRDDRQMPRRAHPLVL